MQNIWSILLSKLYHVKVKDKNSTTSSIPRNDATAAQLTSGLSLCFLVCSFNFGNQVVK